MTKSDLIEKVSERVGSLTRKQTEIVVETVFDSIKDALVKGEKIEIRGFGLLSKEKRSRYGGSEISSRSTENPDAPVIQRRAIRSRSPRRGSCISR